MIRAVGDGKGHGSPMLSALLLGLLLLVAAHLLGALHGPGFVGHHEVVTAAYSAPVDAQVVSAPGPADEHHHAPSDPVEHAVDRLRAPVDQPLDVSAGVSPRVHEAEGADPSAAAPGWIPGTQGPPGFRSLLTLTCVRRQ